MAGISKKSHSQELPWIIAARQGIIPGVKIVHKWGHNTNVGTSFVPVTSSGTYQTPTSAQALEILSSDANDAAAGTGARTVIVEGLDANWEYQT